MILNQIEEIVTHDGKFHADDVMAVAILRPLLPSAKVIRTRRSELVAPKPNRIVIDVGYRYEPERLCFDHHHNDFHLVRPDSHTPYAAAGLIWRHFGEDHVAKVFGEDLERFGLMADIPDLVEEVDGDIIESIDAQDVGTNYDVDANFSLVTFSASIGSLNTRYNRDGYALTPSPEQFELAVAVCQMVLSGFVRNGIQGLKAVRDLAPKIETNQPVLVLERYTPWKRALKMYENRYNFVVYPDEHGSQWRTELVPFAIRKSMPYLQGLPMEWRGLDGMELQKVSEISDAIFVHRNGHIGAARSQESAIRMARRAVKAVTS